MIWLMKYCLFYDTWIWRMAIYDVTVDPIFDSDSNKLRVL